MATTLPNFGTLSYNGIDLSSPYTETLAAAFRPIPDTAGRTVKYVEITLKFKTIINYAESANTELAITNIRNSLTAYGGAFSLSSRGLGNIYANVPGRIEKDVNWGPKPNVVSLKATSNVTAEVVFEIVICLPQCSNAVYQNQLMAANYDLQFDIDEFSQTKRVFKGHIEIPVTRIAQGIRTLPDNADNYLLKIIPSPLTGFKRTISRHLNEAKTLLEVTVTDTEMGLNIPPPGVVLISADHSHSNKEAFNFAQYGGVLSAEYQLQKGTNPEVARQHFFALYEDRKDTIMSSAAVKDGWLPGKKEGDSPKRIRGAVIPCNFSASEPDIYGEVRHCKFSLGYIVTTSLQVMLTAGLWEAVPDSNWLLWSRSMEIMDNPYGLAKLKFENSQDAIIDLCQSVSVLRSNRVSRLRSVIKPNVSSGPQPVAEDESWIDWDNKLTLKITSGNVLHSPTPKIESRLVSKQNLIPVDDSIYKGTRDSSQPNMIIQKRGIGAIEVIMSGYAVRYLYGINEPKLVTVGGVSAIQSNRPQDGYATKQRGLIQFAKWSSRYLLPQVPLVIEALPTLSNNALKFSPGGLVGSAISTLKGKR